MRARVETWPENIYINLYKMTTVLSSILVSAKKNSLAYEESILLLSPPAAFVERHCKLHQAASLGSVCSLKSPNRKTDVLHGNAVTNSTLWNDPRIQTSWSLYVRYESSLSNGKACAPWAGAPLSWKVPESWMTDGMGKIICCLMLWKDGNEQLARDALCHGVLLRAKACGIILCWGPLQIYIYIYLFIYTYIYIHIYIYIYIYMWTNVPLHQSLSCSAYTQPAIFFHNCWVKIGALFRTIFGILQSWKYTIGGPNVVFPNIGNPPSLEKSTSVIGEIWCEDCPMLAKKSYISWVNPQIPWSSIFFIG